MNNKVTNGTKEDLKLVSGLCLNFQGLIWFDFEVPRMVHQPAGTEPRPGKETGAPGLMV
jgi:hypothetical protein